jgi:aromatase
MKPLAPIDDDAMTQRLNHNTAIQMTRIRRIIEEIADRRAADADRAVPAS